jgi:hypothetical protein
MFEFLLNAHNDEVMFCNSIGESLDCCAKLCTLKVSFAGQ